MLIFNDFLFPPKEEMEEFARLSPDEQQKRLKGIIKKIDVDADGFLTEGMMLWKEYLPIIHEKI